MTTICSPPSLSAPGLAGPAQRRIRRATETATRKPGVFPPRFQPRLALGSSQAIGAELLVRWPKRNRDLTADAPGSQMSEAGRQLADAGGNALRLACRMAAGWGMDRSVCVDVSGAQVASTLLLGQIAAALDESGLAPERLEIEIAEIALSIAGDQTFFVLAALRDLGVGITLDHFGDALGSLSMLHRLPLTSVKLGPAFVRDLSRDPDVAMLAESIVRVGHALGLTVAAEGVESSLQRDALALAGVDAAQGALFSDPLADSGIAEWLGPAPSRHVPSQDPGQAAATAALAWVRSQAT